MHADQRGRFVGGSDMIVGHVFMDSEFVRLAHATER
jgi:hypothetical protein